MVSFLLRSRKASNNPAVYEDS